MDKTQQKHGVYSTLSVILKPHETFINPEHEYFTHKN